MSKRLISECRYLICGYGFPADYVVNFLFSMGVKPSNLALLTHSNDARNVGLTSASSLRGVVISQAVAKSDEAFSFAEKFQPDIIISMHYRELIPGRILGLAKIGAFNLHPSILPHYRGANSIPWALINGEKEIGFTYHYMNDKFDEGNILHQESFSVCDSDTAFSLFHRSMLLALSRLSDVINLVIDGCVGVKQPSGGSYYSRALPYGGEIDRSWDSGRVSMFIKAMYFPPFEGAYVHSGTERLFVNNMEDYYRITNSHDLM